MRNRVPPVAVTAKPSGWYVNIHTAEFPPGAIRGQLRRVG